MCDPARVWQASTNRLGDARDAFVIELWLTNGRQLNRRIRCRCGQIFPRSRGLHVAQQLFSILIHHRGVVHMGGMNQYTLSGGARRVRQPTLPLFIGSTAHLTPVETHQHPRLVTPQEHKTLGIQGICHRLRRCDASAHAWMTQRHGDIHAERGQLKAPPLRQCLTRTEQDSAQGGDDKNRVHDNETQQQRPIVRRQQHEP